MKHLLSLLLTAILCAAASAQTIRALGYNTTNGQVVANTGTNVLTFTNSSIQFINVSSGYVEAPWFFVVGGGNAIQFETDDVAATTRTNLGLGATWLTNTNVTNFKNATELQSFRSPDNYAALYWGDSEILNVEDGVNVFYPIYWSGTNSAANAATTRANLGLGATNQVTFGGVFVGSGLAITNNQITGQGITIDFSSGTFSGDSLDSVRSSIGLGLPALTNTSNDNFRAALGLATNGTASFQAVTAPSGFTASSMTYDTLGLRGHGSSIEFFSNEISGSWKFMTAPSFHSATVSGATRTNLNLPLATLTNTSNVTMMRALSGSTSTNHPFSGTVSVVGTNNTNTLTFSNGILQSVQ